MSRLTKQVRLVLISSSLILTGCTRNAENGPMCAERPPNDGKNLPSACGPVDEQRHPSSSTYHHTTGHHFWGWGHSTTGGGTSTSSSGHSSSFSSRGGFGSTGHGAHS